MAGRGGGGSCACGAPPLPLSSWDGGGLRRAGLLECGRRRGSSWEVMGGEACPRTTSEAGEAGGLSGTGLSVPSSREAYGCCRSHCSCCSCCRSHCSCCSFRWSSFCCSCWSCSRCSADLVGVSVRLRVKGRLRGRGRGRGRGSGRSKVRVGRVGVRVGVRARVSFGVRVRVGVWGLGSGG